MNARRSIDFFLRIHIIVFKKVWPFWVGGIVLAVLNMFYLFLTGTAWRISTGFAYWGAWLLELLGVKPKEWFYFQDQYRQLGIEQGFLSNELSMMSAGIIIGALLSVLLSGQFKIKKIKNFKQAAIAFLGGIIMGYATRIALGCNIGSFFSGVASLSLSGYVFGLFVLIGAWLGSKFLLKFLL